MRPTLAGSRRSGDSAVTSEHIGPRPAWPPRTGAAAPAAPARRRARTRGAQGSSVWVASEEVLDSDIDLLVDLEPAERSSTSPPSGARLRGILGIRVDVATPDMLKERIRAEVQNEAAPL